MNVIKTTIDDLVIVEPTLFNDSRGYFFESYNEKKLYALGIQTKFVQDNQSRSCYGVIRGLHYQLNPHAQSKLVRVLSGKILDVCVDLREDSPSYGQHEAIILSSENQRQLFIPRGFAHGFSVLSDEAVVLYKADACYHPESERGIAFDDPSLKIAWQVDPGKRLVSDKDKVHPTLAEAELNFQNH